MAYLTERQKKIRTLKRIALGSFIVFISQNLMGDYYPELLVVSAVTFCTAMIISELKR